MFTRCQSNLLLPSGARNGLLKLPGGDVIITGQQIKTVVVGHIIIRPEQLDVFKEWTRGINTGATDLLGNDRFLGTLILETVMNDNDNQTQFVAILKFASRSSGYLG